MPPAPLGAAILICSRRLPAQLLARSALLAADFGARLGRLSAAQQAEYKTLIEKLVWARATCPRRSQLDWTVA